MYVLIVMSWINGGWSVGLQEFKTQESCEHAAAVIKVGASGVDGGVLATSCVPK